MDVYNLFLLSLSAVELSVLTFVEGTEEQYILRFNNYIYSIMCLFES